ncbi:MAG: hypothetical protein RR516_04005 [Erysipelotrichaceae bacterium]
MIITTLFNRSSYLEVNAAAYVTLDINPSIQFELNKDNEVIKVKSFNDDAKNIINETDVKGLEVNAAISKLIETKEFSNYLLDGYLQVSVYADDEKATEKLVVEIDNNLAKQLNVNSYSCTHANHEEKVEADKYNISFGKYQLIKQIIELDSTKTIDAISNNSMRELMDIYEDLNGTPYQKDHNNGNENHKHEGQNKGNGNKHNQK